MKKTIFALLVVLLAMLAVTCDLLPPDGVIGAAQFSADDPDVVTVGINIADDKARALNKTYSQFLVTTSSGDIFYEVVFDKVATTVPVTPAMTVRDNTDAAKFSTWRVTVPRANYNSLNATDKAVLFVGTKNTKTLLAIGVLTTPANFLVAGSEPSSVMFGLTAITSELKTDSTSSFIINGPGALLSDTNVQNAGAGETIDTVTNPLVHRIPKFSTGVQATYTFGGLVNGVVFLADSGYTFVKAASITNGVSLEITSQPTLSTTLTAPTQGLSFVFDTPDTLGYAKIYVEVPVFAINTAKSDDYGKPEAIMWYIRGGIDNKKVDAGTAASAANLGGAVLIRLYNPSTVDGVGVGSDGMP
ncbi:MAG: hypothetical protein LBQ94_00655 [Treponema sp.]|jgi:hypothetical protein|nr:hypothetical protein [Treponema sp.]